MPAAFQSAPQRQWKQQFDERGVIVVVGEGAKDPELLMGRDHPQDLAFAGVELRESQGAHHRAEPEQSVQEILPILG